MNESRTEGTRLEDVYRRHAGDGVRLAYLITGDRTLAEDVVQDAFVRLAGRLLHLRDPGGVAPYLRQIIVNLANEHFRKRKVERRYLEREAALPEPTLREPDVTERDASGPGASVPPWTSRRPSVCSVSVPTPCVPPPGPSSCGS